MRLATVRRPGGTSAVRIVDGEAVELGCATVGELLRRSDWRAYAAQWDGEALPADELDYAPLLPSPEKIVCVGANYGMNLVDLGRSFPEHPTLFSKYARALIGARDDIILPRDAHACDWEAELGVVIGAPVRRASRDEALAAIAGYTVVNDVTVRDWQYRTGQWLQGKTFEATTPVGPELVVPDDPGGVPTFELSCLVDGVVMQEACTDDLIYGPVELVCYISEIITLMPGDLISTGTPSGVGHGRQPPHWLTDGTLLTTCIEGVGECTNRCVAEA